MPITVNGETYYRTAEVCRTVGISRSTFFRWLRQGSLADAKNVDRRGWRLFTKKDLKKVISIHFLLKVKEYTINGAIKVLKKLK